MGPTAQRELFRGIVKLSSEPVETGVGNASLAVASKSVSIASKSSL